MSSAPGPPSAPGPSRNNDLNAPFPRANNTTRFSLPRRTLTPTAAATPFSDPPKTSPDAVQNRRLPPPRIGGTMGPPPPARRRNAKFDQMFYTSPLPRSISKAYNDLQAGTTAAVPSALRTTAAITTTVNTTTNTNTNTTPPFERAVAAATTTIVASAAEENTIMATATTANANTNANLAAIAATVRTGSGESQDRLNPTEPVGKWTPEENAAMESAARVGAALMNAAIMNAARESVARENAARENAAMEKAAREAVERERERAAKEKAERENAAREKAARENAAKEKAERENAAMEKAAREAVERENAAKEKAARENAARENEARENAAREKAVKEKAAREAAERVCAAKEKAAREAVERENAAKEKAARENAAREKAAREAVERERERAAKEKAARENAAREKAAREAVERAAKEKAARENAAKEKVAKEKAAKEDAERENAAKEMAEKEKIEKEKVEKEKAEKAETAAMETPATGAMSDSLVPVPLPVRSFAEAWADEDDAFMMDISDDDKYWHPSAQNGSRSKPNDDDIQAIATPVHTLKQGAKRADSSSSHALPPRKIARTVAASSPGQAQTRGTAGRKAMKTPVARTNRSSRGVTNIELKSNGTKKSSLVNTAERQKQKPQPGRLSTQKHSNPTAPSIPLRRGSHHIPRLLTGFVAPPGMLATTGSAWDPGSGRRVSRRVSTGIYSYTPSQITNENESVRDTRSERRLLSRRVSMGMISAPSVLILSPVSPDYATVDEDEIQAPVYTPVAKKTLVRKVPGTFLETSNGSNKAVEQEAQRVPDSNTPTASRRSTRNSLGSEQVPDSDPQIPTPDNKPGKQRPRSSHREPQASTDITTTPASRRSTRIIPTGLTERKTPLSKFRHQETPATQSPIPPPPPPPLPSKRARRSLQSELDLPSASTVSNIGVVVETPPKARVRTTRASTARKKRINPEFEFSDGEPN